MRIWSLHPKYLDTKGLLALWRETLLAKKVLENRTIGYKNHPQLKRFKNAENPLAAINQYLSEVHEEACRREYHFDKNKINWGLKKSKLTVTKGQLEYEKRHLLNKLENRDPERFRTISKIKFFETNFLFELIEGEIEDWETIK
ncbi:MAG TPA: pyrimidine dimer DNA glycosylase/endonuclease V [Puia sp.]|nr:pyrimidine dimer DNA glycosylase/endonuclease V [Puia sp.]